MDTLDENDVVFYLHFHYVWLTRKNKKEKTFRCYAFIHDEKTKREKDSRLSLLSTWAVPPAHPFLLPNPFVHENTKRETTRLNTRQTYLILLPPNN